MSSPGSLPELIVGLFWPPHAITQVAIGALLGFALLVVAFVYGPLALRLLQIGSLRRSVQACFDEEGSNAVQRQEVGNAFSESPLAYQWSDFVRRWQNAIAADPIQNASLPELSRAPVRLMDVLEEHPLIPAGSRRSLLPALPAIFLSAGLLGAFAGLVFALPGIGLSLDPPAFEASSRSHQVGALMEHLGMALRIGLWGLMLSLAAAIGGRLIEGRSEALAESLDGWVQLAYGAISTGELATRTAHEHRAAISRLQADVGELVRQVSGRPRPLVRSSSAPPGAGPVAAPDTDALEAMVSALGGRLTEHVDRTLAEQLAGLRESVGGAVERLGASPSGSPEELSRAVEHLARTSESQDAASRNLTQTAHTVSDAAEELRSGLDDFADVVTRMRETSEALRLAAGRVDTGHTSTTRAGEQLGSSLERLEERADAQRAELVTQLDALRASFAGLTERLDRSPELPEATEQAAANRHLEEGMVALRGAVEQLAEQIGTLEPQRATEPDEPPTPETEAALEPQPAPAEPAAIPGSAVEQEEEREQEQEEEQEEETEEAAHEEEDEQKQEQEEPMAEPEPPPVTPSPPAPPAQSSEADTIPYMKAPTPEMIYAARPSDETAQPPPGSQSGTGGGGTLSGLLRATHHSGPSAGVPPAPDDFDPEATVSLDEFPPDPDDRDEADEAHQPDDDTPPKRSGFFGRRK